MSWRSRQPATKLPVRSRMKPANPMQPHEKLHRVFMIHERRELEPDALLFAKSVSVRIRGCHGVPFNAFNYNAQCVASCAAIFRQDAVSFAGLSMWQYPVNCVEPSSIGHFTLSIWARRIGLARSTASWRCGLMPLRATCVLLNAGCSNNNK